MNLSRSTGIGRSGRTAGQRAMAVVIVLILLSIILIFVAANLRVLYSLDRELELTEQQQRKRLEALSAANHAALRNPARQ